MCNKISRRRCRFVSVNFHHIATVIYHGLWVAISGVVWRGDLGICTLVESWKALIELLIDILEQGFLRTSSRHRATHSVGSAAFRRVSQTHPPIEVYVELTREPIIIQYALINC